MSRYTYASGFKFSTTGINGIITKGMIQLLCLDLSETFNNWYKQTNVNNQNTRLSGHKEYYFEPEPISEGGIIMRTWPGKHEGQYKSMRIPMMNPVHGSSYWPIIQPHPMIHWYSNNEIIWKSNGDNVQLTIETVFKSFYGAPCWTMHELVMIAKCLEKHGFRILYDTFPDENKLTSLQG